MNPYGLEEIPAVEGRKNLQKLNNFFAKTYCYDKCKSKIDHHLLSVFSKKKICCGATEVLPFFAKAVALR